MDTIIFKSKYGAIINQCYSEDLETSLSISTKGELHYIAICGRNVLKWLRWLHLINFDIQEVA